MLERIALGTVQFGMRYGVANDTGQVSLDEIASILNLARERGVDTLDTAIAYGESERRLGDVGIPGWRTVTKLPPVPADVTNVSRWVAESIASSLERLRVDRVHGLLLHRSADLDELFGEELFAAMAAARDRGLVSKIGVSLDDPGELATLTPRYRFDLVQAPFNVIDRRLTSSGWLARLHANGVEVHTRSAFLQGLLLMAPARRPSRFERWGALLKRWDDWRTSAGLTPVAACLAFVLAQTAIDRVVVGVDGTEQFKEILAASAATACDVPDELESGDQDLINPARWRTE
jgi:aryl-alcohol dehydrogenase-like predicted oxidoreductase